MLLLDNNIEVQAVSVNRISSKNSDKNVSLNYGQTAKPLEATF
jgi:hypothetical protein